MFSNFGLPTKFQWKRVVLNSVLVFVASFITALQALGFDPFNPASLLVMDVSFSVLVSASITAVFAVFKALWTTFFDPSVK